MRVRRWVLALIALCCFAWPGKGGRVPSGQETAPERVLWRVRLYRPYADSRAQFAKDVRRQARGAMTYKVESESTILLCADVAWALDYVAEADYVRGVEQVAERCR